MKEGQLQRDHHESFSDRHPQAALLMTPITLGILYLLTSRLTTNVYIADDAEISEHQTFEADPHRKAKLSSNKRNITVPSGGRAEVVVNDVRILIDDFRRRGAKKRAEADIRIGEERTIISDGKEVLRIGGSEVRIIHKSNSPL